VTGRFIHLGRALQARVREFFDSPIAGTAMPLELVQGALAILERKVQPLGRGRRTFPYNRVTIRVGPGAVDRTAIQAAFEGFEERLRERFAELKCDTPAGLVVRQQFLEQPAPEWLPGQVFSVECAAEPEAASPPAPAPQQPALAVTIVKGAATQPSYAFTQPVVAIGRTEDPVDARGTVRRNHVVFTEAVDGATETVGRAHARFEFDAAHGAYRIFNDGSSNPTVISRAGAMIPVHPRDPRGVRVQSGDEIQLGRALIRIDVRDRPSSHADARGEEQPETLDVAG
jgi:hypothetical protein